jgi:uncharacterized Ntn-hydrolase superfamily protein
MTYSIVARDPRSGELGVAVQSHWFAVGPIVPWAEAGVGAVATQSFVEPAYGPRALARLRAGGAAPEVLAALVGEDPGEATRQVAIVDAAGRVAVHTGPRCVAAAGHLVGDGFAVQANMMTSDAVWPAMARAFTSSAGPLAERLLAALDAAEAAGGDVRGRQSAALVVVAPRGHDRPWPGPGGDRPVDLRVDDHLTPLVELRRLLLRHRAYEHMNQGDGHMERSDYGAASAAYRAAASLVPDEPELVFWHGVALISAGRIDDGAALLGPIVAADARFATLLGRLPAAGLLPDEPELLRRLLR